MPFSDTIAPFCEEGIQKEGKHVPWGCLAFVLCVMAGYGRLGAGWLACEDYNPGGAMFAKPSTCPRSHGGAEGGRWRPAPALRSAGGGELECSRSCFPSGVSNREGLIGAEIS